MARKKTTYPLPVTALSHKDKRANIPTEELQSFVADQEKTPKKVLYPRDPSLDPQLVWKGKDEQDSKPLEVPAVPVYIQEKIHPRAIIEQVRAEANGDAPAQAELFSDFNGIKFEDLVDFYHHEQNWSNRMILGDSLLVMTSLAEKEGLKGKVQMIYMDPPYGINFGSNWQVSTRKRDVKDGKAEDLTRQPEQIRAFRDTWQLGIHSYLSYLRDRLVLARDLLTETGSVFVQINSENSHLMRNLLDEVFGSENFIADIYFRKKSIPLGAKYLETMHDQILFYAKDAENVKFRHLYEEMDASMLSSHGPYALYPDDRTEKIKIEDVFSSTHPTGTRYYRLFSLLAPSFSASTAYTFKFMGRTFSSPNRGSWVVSKEKLEVLAAIGRLQPEGINLSYRLFYDDFPYRKRTNTWTDAAVSYEKSYVVQTSPDVIARCILMTTDPGDLVFDPTCGSGTTAYVAEQWGRRWITCDTSRVALALARTRLMAAKFPYFLLADSTEGIKKGVELSGKTTLERKTENDIRKGFVYRRVPHVTLKSIANNPDIKKGMTQQQIVAAIARHAETETLYDQPYEDAKRVRVAGPFTVESLSPHRVLPGVDQPISESSAKRDDAGGQFVAMILENLRKAGVQTSRKGEHLSFDSLDSYAGTWIQGVGQYSRADGTARRVAISIGPEHGTVGTEQIKEAAKEAVKGTGFDELILCGFAFDAHAGETAKEFTPTDQNTDGNRRKDGASIVAESRRQFGKLQITLAKMNPDLAMGEELLKSTGAGNLFMAFGELDIAPLDKKTGRLLLDKSGKCVVELRGVDVYDPTTGQIRNSDAAEDVACWFIDTNYNGESFFVRHAYFTGGGEPYERLKRALRAEIDESAWSALYSATSQPFDPPKSGKIAIKVINHFGDEVLKILEVEGGQKKLR